MFDVVSESRDTSAGRSYHPGMASWRSPYCSTPQQEASRCWVCHRSSTSCGTCRHFRGSVAAHVGFCGLDRRHEPLQGDEVRPCWVDAALTPPPDPATPGLLDLLTVGAIGTAPLGEPETLTAPPAATSAEPRFTVNASSRGSGRLWVEVDASRR
jgi:hypothetical protein